MSTATTPAAPIAANAHSSSSADRHLQLAPDVAQDDCAALAAWRAARPPLLRVCAGEPLVVTDEEVDLVALVNRAAEIRPWLLDDAADPDDYRLAEVLLDYACQRYGIQRRGKGDRFTNVESIYRRHLLPFLVELAAGRPAGQRGAGATLLRDLETLPAILAGDAPLSAAAVAGDHLGRRAIACVFLAAADAARVVVGGAAALAVATADGRVPLHADARTGQDIVRSADLRAAGLLVERTKPHGCAKSTAENVLRDLKSAIGRARALGANIRGTFDLVATEPLPQNRMRAARVKAVYVSLTEVLVNIAHLPAIGQVILWLERLTGVRISEGYGPQVGDYWRDASGQAWLRIDKQGGVSSLGREPSTGKFVAQDGKGHTKTTAGERDIPLPWQLAALIDLLIAIFHTDAETGLVDMKARLVPGIQSEDTSGQSSFRTWLGKAQQQSGTCFRPHDLRAALITDLKNEGIEERLAYYYAGHEQPGHKIQDVYYDRGPAPELLLDIARRLERRLDEELGSPDLHRPTTVRESWGRCTRRHRDQEWIEQQLIRVGWRLTQAACDGGSRRLRVSEVAARIGKSQSRAKALMISGAIPAMTEPWGQRSRWVADEADVQSFLDDQAGTTLTDLAAELDIDYHQAWQLAQDLHVTQADHQRGAAIRLSLEAVAQFKDEMRRRSQVSAQAVSLAEAADLLQMQITTVETLVRQGHLLLVEGPTTARRRYVSRDSVEAYLAAYPIPTAEAGAGECDVLLTCTQAAKLARVTRPKLTTLINTRQVLTAGKPGSRHIYVIGSSLLGWAERTSQPAVAAAVRSLKLPSEG